MNAHAPKALLILALTPFSFTMGCDQPIGDGMEELDRDAELDLLDAPEELAALPANDLDLDIEDIVDEEGRPLTSEILVVNSSPEEQVGDELTAEEGDAPTLEALGHAIGIGPDDVPVHADELVSEDDPTAALALDYEGSSWFGNDMFGKSFDIIRGHSSCGAGRTRAFAHAYVEGSGSCYVVGWYTFDPNDCRIRVRINQPGWFASGTCKMFVYDQ